MPPNVRACLKRTAKCSDKLWITVLQKTIQTGADRVALLDGPQYILVLSDTRRAMFPTHALMRLLMPN